MGHTVCTEPQWLDKGDLYLFLSRLIFLWFSYKSEWKSLRLNNFANPVAGGSSVYYCTCHITSTKYV